MDAKLLRLIMLFGAIFAIIPPVIKVNKIKTKLYASVVATIAIVASAFSGVYYRLPLYANFTTVKLVLTIGMVIIVTVSNCYTVLAPVFCKRKQYCFLMKLLEESDNESIDDFWEQVPFYVRFLLPNLIYWIINAYVVYVWTDILGSDYYQEYFVEVVQLYLQFFYSYFLCIVIKIFLGKYKHVNFLLTQQLLKMQMGQKETSLSLKKIENMVCALKELNAAFNDVFGLPIIMIILYSSMLLLNYFDGILKNSLGYKKSQYLGVIISNVSVAFLTNIGSITLMVLCDLVVEEAKKIIFISYKLRQFAAEKEKREICDFIHLVSDNFPEFTAAGFFFINKATIFHIISTTTTFFIIIIQFNTSSSL